MASKLRPALTIKFNYKIEVSKKEKWKKKIIEKRKIKTIATKYHMIEKKLVYLLKKIGIIKGILKII